MRRGCLLLLALILSACSASGPAYKSVKSTIPPLDNKHGRVYFYRSDAFFGSGMKQWIFLDGERVGKSQAGGVFYVDVKPGEHVSTMKNKVYSGQGSLKFAIAGGETKYIQTWLGGSSFAGRINQTLKPVEEALPEIEALAFTGKPSEK